MRRAFCLLVLLPLALGVSCSEGTPNTSGPPGDSPEPADKMTLRVESKSFADGASIPKKYTCDGTGISPPLVWTGAPKETRSFALICEDPDAPRGTFTHWLIYNIPPNITELKEGLPATPDVKLVEGTGVDVIAQQGKNDFKKPGYGGPCPPSGSHRYIFLVYALDSNPSLPADIDKGQLIQAIMPHILAAGRLIGTYSR
jgi:Raf kinase inhibitor-like YbhB/YbcL family protein